jgi:hypothetical protein
MSGNYDVQQVCENGHQITDCYNIRPEKQKKFCQKCGAATIIACKTCNEKIQGAQIKASQDFTVGGHWSDTRTVYSKMLPGFPTGVPSYCSNCGKPYPWTENKIMTAIQILAEFGNLDEEEKKTINQDVENIAKDVPEAELSARRIKRIWEKCSRAGYEVIMELASRTAAKILKDQ